MKNIKKKLQKRWNFFRCNAYVQAGRFVKFYVLPMLEKSFEDNPRDLIELDFLDSGLACVERIIDDKTIPLSAFRNDILPDAVRIAKKYYDIDVSINEQYKGFLRCKRYTFYVKLM